MDSGCALYQDALYIVELHYTKVHGTYCIVAIQNLCTMHSGNALYQGARSMVLGRSASYHGQLCIMHCESTPYHSAQCTVNGGHTSF